MNTLFDQPKEEIQQIRKETDDAINRGVKHANQEWKQMAIRCVKAIAETKEEFTMNDVRSMVRLSPIKTQDNRAMGGVIKHAQKLGWVRPSGNSIISRVGHGVPLQIWKSLIFKKG